MLLQILKLNKGHLEKLMMFLKKSVTWACFFGASMLIFILLSHCGSTRYALRTHDDLKWASKNYYSNTISLFESVFVLENRNLHNASVYHLSEIYFDLKVIPAVSASSKKVSRKKLQKSEKNQRAKTRIINLLKKRYMVEKDFNVKNMILQFIASVGNADDTFTDEGARKKALSESVLFIAGAILDSDPLVAQYAMLLLATEDHLQKYRAVDAKDKEKIISTIEKYFSNRLADSKDGETMNFTSNFVLNKRLYKIVFNFDSESPLLQKIENAMLISYRHLEKPKDTSLLRGASI